MLHLSSYETRFALKRTKFNVKVLTYFKIGQLYLGTKCAWFHTESFTLKSESEGCTDAESLG